MSKNLINDSKKQMRQNIKQHRQKLLQYLENSNDTLLKPKIESISNDIEKYNLTHNFKPKIESSADILIPKLEPKVEITNYHTRSIVGKKNVKPVVNEKKVKVLTDNDTKKYNTRSGVTVNQLQQPNVEVIKLEETLSNDEFYLEPVPNIEIKEPEPPIIFLKKLKEQLLLEELDDTSFSEETDDDISVGNDDWSEYVETNNDSNEDKNDSSNSDHLEFKYDEHKQPANKEQHFHYSSGSGKPVLDIDYPTTRKGSQIVKKKTYKNKKDPKKRSTHNAIEREHRLYLSKLFDNLRKLCSYLSSNRRVPSKHSILLAAKKECDLLKHFEQKMLTEKKFWLSANKDLRNRIKKIKETTDYV